VGAAGVTVRANEEELMAKDKQRREAKKPKKKAPKADPATRRGSTTSPTSATILPSQPPRS
jgi:hypothetical protein